MGKYTKEEALQHINICNYYLSFVSNRADVLTIIFWICTLLSYKACIEFGYINNSSIQTKYGYREIYSYRNIYAHADEQLFDKDYIRYITTIILSIDDEDINPYKIKLIKGELPYDNFR